jgi:hypothetical protein
LTVFDGKDGLHVELLYQAPASGKAGVGTLQTWSHRGSKGVQALDAEGSGCSGQKLLSDFSEEAFRCSCSKLARGRQSCSIG